MIIAHNNDYNEFEALLKSSVSTLETESLEKIGYYLTRDGIKFEKDVFRIMKERAHGTIYENKIELVSGQKFPDIVAHVNEQKAYGLEVKTTKSNSWQSIGSSIFEGTRVSNIRKIHLLFGKLSEPIEFKCKPYEQCLIDVAITHSPRYKIDMLINENESIFSKVGVDYETIRNLDNPFAPIKKYLRNNLEEGEDLWWVDYNDNDGREFKVKSWNNLSQNKKHELTLKGLAYFPSLLGSDKRKYNKLSTWLVSQHGIVNHALRDTFTAGGKIQINSLKFPKIFKFIKNDITDILDIVRAIPLDDAEYYWGEEANIPIKTWKKLAMLFSKEALKNEQHNVITDIIKNASPTN